MTRMALALSLLFAVAAFGQVHVAPDGNDENDGSQAKPAATLARALAIADARGGEQTLVLHAGLYRENVVIDALANAPALTITAASTESGGYARVVFDQGYAVDNAEPVVNMPGVFRVPIPKGYNAYQSRRAMWEADTRTRYRRMADVRAVAAFAASYRFEPVSYSKDEGWLYFHTSDGRESGLHEIGFDISDDGFSVRRDNVTVRGLHFQNGGGIGVGGANVVIEDCSAWNIARMAVYISASCPLATVRRFTATDVGAGIYSEGRHTIVEDCRLFRPHDSFESEFRDQQNSAGIQLYSPAVTGDIRGNLVVGFRTGIFCKGTKNTIVVENNTCYGGEGGAESTGITFTHWREGCTMRNNIVSGYADAYAVAGFGGYGPNVTFRDNVLWDVYRKENIAECFTQPRRLGSGQGVELSDPRFAAPLLGDFRLLPDSPVLRGDGVQIGAFPRTPENWQDTQPPSLVVTLDAPATLLGQTVEHFFELDHWQEGGGTLEQRETTFESDANDQWLIPEPKVKLKLTASDNASSFTQMKLRVGDNNWSEPTAFAWTTEVVLTDVDTKLSLMVADQLGNWSKPATVRVFRVTAAPQIIGDTHTYGTRNGMVVAFQTDVPCDAHLEWGTDDQYDHTTRRAADVIRNWNAGDGGEWTEKRTGPTREHVLAIQAPDVEAGATLNYRVVLDDGVGHVTRSEVVQHTLAGDSRTIVIDPAGEDVEGSTERWRSLQFAVDRALPGDRIVLRDGLYPGVTTIRRGGIAAAPLVIEAEHPGKATLDVGKMHRGAVEMNNVPHVTLRGLEVRWFNWHGIHITDSPHVTLENMTFWNEHLIKGRRGGSGFYARRSPHLTVRHCLFFYMNEGFVLLDSPQFLLENNTIGPQVHRGCRILYSTRDSTLINNCFAFTGNDHLQVYEDPDDWKTFTCDYNNYPAMVRDIAPRRPDEDDNITRWSGSNWARPAKGVNNLFLRKGGNWDQFHCFSLAEWQEKSGKDAHSIYERPLFVNPFENDWRLQPNSPNIGAGKYGALIGATKPIDASAGAALLE